MPLPTREELESRYGQMVAEQQAREAAAARQITQGVIDFGKGATRLPYRVAGTPVDLINLPLNALRSLANLPTTETPVGGSNWLIDIASQGGLAYPRTDNGMETLGDIASGFISTPGVVSKVASGLERGTDYARYAVARLGALGRSGGDRGLAEAQAAATRAAGGIQPLTASPTAPINVAGTPYVAGPVRTAVKAAKDYMANTGLPYEPPQTFKKVDWDRAGRIAKAYEEMPHAPDDPRVKASYDAMIKETLDQWDAIKKTGLKVEFIKPGMKDPYEKSPRQAIMDVRDNNHLWVFPTTGGFGGSESAHVDIAGNPLLRKTGETIDGIPVTANDIFRIVHDYFGHIKYGHGFRWDGEENAWRAHAAMYSPLARPAMSSETRGQNSWVNFGPYGEHNRKASAADTQYAPQKTGLLPDWVFEEGLADDPYPTQQFKAPAAQVSAGLTTQREAEKRRNAPKK